MEQVVIARELQDSRMAIFGSYQPRYHTYCVNNTPEIVGSVFRLKSRRLCSKTRKKRTIKRRPGLFVTEDSDDDDGGFLKVDLADAVVNLDIDEILNFDSDFDDDSYCSSGCDNESPTEGRRHSSGFYEDDNSSCRSFVRKSSHRSSKLSTRSSTNSLTLSDSVVIFCQNQVSLPLSP